MNKYLDAIKLGPVYNVLIEYIRDIESADTIIINEQLRIDFWDRHEVWLTYKVPKDCEYVILSVHKMFHKVEMYKYKDLANEFSGRIADFDFNKKVCGDMHNLFVTLFEYLKERKLV